MNIIVKMATEEDAADLIEVQNKAFLSDYLLYGECPGYNKTNESMKKSIKQCHTFKIMDENTFIGDVIVRYNGNNNYYLGALCVIPEYENRGIGQKVMSFIFDYFVDAKHWSLETPADKKRNHHFYKKLGFNITKEYMAGSVKVVLFEKNLQ
ncbi:GNAT family N-acetyltransferase [Clostridium sporogenes]|uniref:GNAT family N-acetyltransferase n=1 Tax=Clostridium sporogenes TaxID=1509 RepID=UPI0013CF9C0B|nr:GNAT family N-acetyltransferase [Clostridium sporogenes]MBU5299213.1 GNAT family N-acetyltransferase [Clostridium sporogenes]NFE80962.1 GNAT family N-acetyltransferase [Clostridium sporogenes]NFG67307.1 GNAT family N-acetyltransferase [Clostridium sporogenes]